MDRYTYETSCWLDVRFDPQSFAAFGQDYDPYQPVHGIADDRWGPDQFLMVSRYARLLAHLSHLEFSSFLDVGGAEGFVAWLVQDVFGAEATSVDLSIQAGLRASQFFDVPSAAVDAARLPFADDSFDVVFLSEVLEHLAHPVRTLAELQRVARVAVIVTTEAYARTEEERQEELDARDLQPHMDRSIFCASDFPKIFPGMELAVLNQASRMPSPIPSRAADVQAAIAELLDDGDLAWPSHGIFVVAHRGALRDVPADEHRRWMQPLFERLAPRRREMTPRSGRTVPRSLLARLRCPVGRTPLSDTGEGLESEGRTYMVVDGVPSLVTPEGTPFPEDLPTRLAAVFEGTGADIDELVRLDELLRFDLPPAVTGSEITAGHESAWEAGPGVVLEPLDGGGLRVTSAGDDPQLYSPRLARPMAEVGGFRLRLRVVEGTGDEEQLQVYWWSLRRPLWHELCACTFTVPADGEVHELTFEGPRSLDDIPGDEMLRVRIDPSHHRSVVEILSFEVR